MKIIGKERLHCLEAMFALMGGNPFGYYPVDMVKTIPGIMTWKGSMCYVNYKKLTEGQRYLMEEICDLRRVVSEAESHIARAKSHLPGHYCREAVEAFEKGINFEPPCFEYGMGSGNYISDLVSKDGVLYYVAHLQNYRERLVPIATA